MVFGMCKKNSPERMTERMYDEAPCAIGLPLHGPSIVSDPELPHLFQLPPNSASIPWCKVWSNLTRIGAETGLVHHIKSK